MREFRLMRGQVVVRELPKATGVIWEPEPKPREVKTHRGIVLGMGPPAKVHGHEVAHGFRVGDVVQYHFSGHHQEAWTHDWPADGKPATWIPQHDVDGVYECGHVWTHNGHEWECGERPDHDPYFHVDRTGRAGCAYDV